MFNKKKTKIIVTLGPSTKTEADLRKIKDKGVDFVRINMSHSSVEDLEYFIDLAKKVGLEFIIDTEGSQVRNGKLENGKISLKENDELRIYNSEIIGNAEQINLKPGHILEQLEPGDLLYVDFDAVILRISDISMIKQGYVTAKVASEGGLGSNKAVIIHSGLDRKFDLPTLSEKDYQSIELGLKNNINYIAASFIRSAAAINEVRRATKNKMKIISKVECVDALENLDEIIEATDFILIDRGDLSKEIPLERIPFTQKVIIGRAKKRGVGVFVATNLLETMVENKKPTRAEVHDIAETIIDGALGLILSAETAIGKYPIECLNTLNKIIAHTEIVVGAEDKNTDSRLFKKLEDNNYLLNKQISSALIPPHGGRLVSRILKQVPKKEYLKTLPKINISQETEMDIEQIAIGTFSPLEGFLCEKDFISVLDNLRLASGIVWPLPIVLDISEEEAKNISVDDEVILSDHNGEDMALLHVEDIYRFNKEEMAEKLYGTNNPAHPGVGLINRMKPILVGGKIDLIKRRDAEFKEYELTPAQVRGLFEEKNWSKVVGFHTRNVIHRSHEFIQLQALNQENCDGLFVHPIIGKKKAGDYEAKYIISSYEKMIKDFYPKNKVVFSVFSTFSRYAGPREALFTALCRKNFGCSHFIVGRDHTGVGDFYSPYASHEIFDKFDDIGIKPIKFEKVFYSKKNNQHIHEKETSGHEENDKLHISGTEARKIFESGQIPPEWFMRSEISEIINSALNRGERVFVRPENKRGQVIWFTGLSGSGKSTLAQELKNKLDSIGKRVEIVDGDTVRNTLNKHLSFSRDNIRENNQLIAQLAKEKAEDLDFVLVPVIAPYLQDRKMIRDMIGKNYIELFVNCPIEKCIERDTKGLYKKALSGEIKDFIGISQANPYEVPANHELEIKTHELNLEEAVKTVIDYLKNKLML